jgi:hypothetical protein
MRTLLECELEYELEGRRGWMGTDGINEKCHYFYSYNECGLLIAIFKSASIEDGAINPI